MGPNFGKTFQTSALTIQLAKGANHVPYLPRNFAYKKPRWFTKGNYVPVTGTVTSIKRINHHVLLSKQLVRQQQHGPCSLCWKARLKNIVRWFVVREKQCFSAEKEWLISQANRAGCWLALPTEWVNLKVGSGQISSTCTVGELIFA